MGMLMQFAAATDTKGTILPARGGKVFTIALSPKAVPIAAPVARTYEVPVIYQQTMFKILPK